MMRVNDGFKLSTAATEIALNNRRLVENLENFGGQNWLLRPIQPALYVKKARPLGLVLGVFLNL